MIEWTLTEEDFKKVYNRKKELCGQIKSITPVLHFIDELSNFKDSWQYIKRVEQDLYDDGYIHHRINTIDDCAYIEWNMSWDQIRYYLPIIRAYRALHPDEKAKDCKYVFGNYKGLFKDLLS